MKKFTSFILTIAIILSCTVSTFAYTHVDPTIAFDMSLARLNGAYDYLNEVYLTTDIGYDIDYCTPADIETLTDVAEWITKGCTTDKEKCEAIYNWMYKNIKYSPNYFTPMDVFRNMEGICTGHALLFSTFTKCLDIPTAICRGQKCNTTVVDIGHVYNHLDGHEWVMAYCDDDWYCYDTLWGTHTNDKEAIAEQYFLEHVDGITAYCEDGYDLDKQHIWSITRDEILYVDGEYVYIQGGMYKAGGFSLSVGGGVRYYHSIYAKETDVYNTYYGDYENTTYYHSLKGGWYFSKLTNNKFNYLTYSYVRYNGCTLINCFKEFNGTTYYLGSSGNAVFEPTENTTFIKSYVGVHIDETLFIEAATGSSDESVFKVENGVITPVSTGYAKVYLNDSTSRGIWIQVYDNSLYSKCQSFLDEVYEDIEDVETTDEYNVEEDTIINSDLNPYNVEEDTDTKEVIVDNTEELYEVSTDTNIIDEVITEENQSADYIAEEDTKDEIISENETSVTDTTLENTEDSTITDDNSQIIENTTSTNPITSEDYDVVDDTVINNNDIVSDDTNVEEVEETEEVENTVETINDIQPIESYAEEIVEEDVVEEYENSVQSSPVVETNNTPTNNVKSKNKNNLYFIHLNFVSDIDIDFNELINNDEFIKFIYTVLDMVKQQGVSEYFITLYVTAA